MLEILTDPKQAEDLLKASRRYLQAIFDNSLDAILVTNDEGRYIDANPAASKLLGYTHDELMELSFLDLLEPRLRRAGWAMWEQFLATGSNSGEFPTVRKDGTLIRLEFRAVANILPGVHVSSSRDITERKRAEEAQRNAEQKYRDIFENSAGAIFQTTPEGRFVAANPALARMFGFDSPEELIRERADISKQHYVDPERREAFKRRLAEEGVVHNFEYEGYRKDGSKIWVSDIVRAVRDDNGTLLYYEGTTQDITEQKRVAQAQRESQQQYETLVQSIDGIVWEADPKSFTFTFVSKQAEKILGYPLEQWFEGSSFWPDHMHPDDRDWAVDFCVEATARGVDHQFEYRMIAADGRVVWLRAIVTVSVADDESVLLRGLMVDITERKLTEQRLRQGERQLAEAQHLASVGSWNWDLQKDIHVWSDELYRIYGLDPQESDPGSETFLEVVHPDERDHVTRLIEHTIKTQEPVNAYIRIIRPDGAVRIVHSRGTIVSDVRGIPLRMHGTVQDVTERKQSEEALHEAEQKYRDIFENAVEGIFQTTPEGRFAVANPALARMFGFDSPEEMIRERDDISKQQYVDSKRRDEFKRRLAEEGVVHDFEYEVYRKDGSKFWVSDIVRAVRDNDGTLLYYEGTTQDITERKRAEEALRESEERYRELFENAKDATYVHDLSGRYLSVNRSAEKLSGRSREEIIGRRFSDFLPPEQFEVAGDHLCKKLAQEGETTYETEVVARDGKRIPVEVSSHLIYENGIGVGVQGTARDITERKRAEERLREYERVVEGLEEMIVVVDRDFRYLLANQSFLKYRGRTREQVIGHLTSEIVGTELFEGLIKKQLEQSFRGQVVSFELKTTYPNLGERNMLVSLMPIEGPTGIDRLACVLKDITESKQAEEALRESEARTRAILESAMDCIITMDHEGLIVDWNPAAERAFGYSSEEVIGKEMAKLIIPTRHRERHRRGLARLLATGKARALGKRMELSALRSDGTEFPVELTITQIELEGKPIFTGYLRDITKDKQADEALQRYPRQLIEAQETERKHIARELHDQVGQVLTAIKTNLQSIGSSAETAVPGALIEQGVGLIDTALEQVRNLSFELRPSLLDNLGLEAALRWYCDQFTQRTGITARSTRNLPGGYARLGNELETACFRIVQEALTNVVRHAKAKNVSVELSAVDQTIALSIKDDGIGFDEPPPKDGAPSASLGLRGMRERALALGGRLEIESGPMQGTEIRACFPNCGKKG